MLQAPSTCTAHVLGRQVLTAPFASSGFNNGAFGIFSRNSAPAFQAMNEPFGWAIFALHSFLGTRYDSVSLTSRLDVTRQGACISDAQPSSHDPIRPER